MVVCAEKHRLAVEYEIASRKFAAAIASLQEKMGTTPRGRYERLLRLSDEARVKSEQARLALEKHTAQHNCL